VARIVISSYVVRMPVGGYQSWILQWLLGFRRLGHEVWFVEKSGWAGSCIDPITWARSDDCTQGTAAWNVVLGRFGLERNWCYVDAAGIYHGMSRGQVEEVFRTADVFIDHMRRCEWEEEAATAGTRVLIDGEPAYTQAVMTKSANGSPLMEYDHYFSVGLNIGTSAATAPTAGKVWRPIVDPVVVDIFPSDPPPHDAPFTTIMAWRSKKPIEFEGTTYGTKHLGFEALIDLPSRTTAPLELAISGKFPRKRLLDAGWRLRDSAAATLTYDAWRSYIERSRGEIGICKSYFVATNSGAFSDRSAAYLASGRPVVMQDTGFSAHLPCGRGLFAFRTVDEAAAAIDAIQTDYDRQSKWARAMAMEYLAAEKVLATFLRQIGL
jgi:hypothetical protein